LYRFGAHARALVEAFVSPDVNEAVGRAELDKAGEHDRRELGALGKLRFPVLRHVGRRTGLERIRAQLEEGAHLPRTHLGYEREWIDDLRAHGANEVADLGRPARMLDRLGADARALGEVAVRPDVDDFVQRADLRVPEGSELGELLTVLV